MTHRRIGYTAGALTIAATLAAAPSFVSAQEEGPNTGKISLNAGVNFTNEYWFRGIAQQNQGLIAQPSVSLGFDLIEGENFGVDATIGSWNSWHFQDPNPEADGDDDFWYEADISAGLAFDLPGDFSASLTYINLYSPQFGDEFAEEIDLGVSYDDSSWWGEDSTFSLSPSATLAYEIDGGSDSGNNKGTYLGLGLNPSFQLNKNGSHPITVGVPMTLGLGDDYYEDGNGNDDTYGFFDVGLTASTPLVTDSDYGTWTLSGGVHYIDVGDTAATIGDNFGIISASDDNSVYFNVGISMSY